MPQADDGAHSPAHCRAVLHRGIELPVRHETGRAGHQQVRQSFGHRRTLGGHLLVPGQALGLFPDLRRGQGHAGAAHFLQGLVALRLQDKNRGGDLTAFPEVGYRDPQAFQRRLEDQDGLSGYQPAAGILHQLPFDADP